MTALSVRLADAAILIGLWAICSLVIAFLVSKAIAFADRRQPERVQLAEDLAALRRVAGDHPRKVRL